MYKLILLDLDGTLLDSRKNISEYTLDVLKRCRSKGMLVGIATARSELLAEKYINRVNPDIVISNSGGLVRYNGEIIFSCMFSEEETSALVQAGLDAGLEITVDTPDKSYENFKVDLSEQFPDWRNTIHTDYSDFHDQAFKVCIQSTDVDFAEAVAARVKDCVYIPFSDCDWFKFSKSTASKEKAIPPIEAVLGISADEIISFGDDYVDIEMLKYCGKGVAMGNAIDEVKRVADEIIGDNDSDGVAVYLDKIFLQ